MGADPEPLEAILAFDGDCAVLAANARRPQVSMDALEVQRRMFRVALQQSEVPVRDRTNIGSGWNLGSLMCRMPGPPRTLRRDPP